MSLGDLPAYWRDQAQEAYKRFHECGDMNSSGAGMYMSEGDTLQRCAHELEIAIRRVNTTVEEIIDEATS
jgi:hypothetical protein